MSAVFKDGRGGCAGLEVGGIEEDMSADMKVARRMVQTWKVNVWKKEGAED